MANVTVTKHAQTSPSKAAPAPAWDPFRAVREMMRWDPFREMTPFFAAELPGFEPAFDVKETADSYLFRADVPGLKAEDLSITLDGGRLVVSGKRESDREEKTDTYYACERSFGSFMRSFTLPPSVDAKSVHADLTDGILTISIGKLAEARPQKISIEAKKAKS